jgi:hypothetical protein
MLILKICSFEYPNYWKKIEIQLAYFLLSFNLKLFQTYVRSPGIIEEEVRGPLQAKNANHPVMYSALPERSGAFCWSLVDQPRYFKSQVLVQGYKMGLKEWIWKNKPKWKQFEIYKIDSIYGRFSKTFNIVWKNLKKKMESIAWDVREMIINAIFLPKWNIGSQWSAKQGQIFEIQCLWDSQMHHSTVSKNYQ